MNRICLFVAILLCLSLAAAPSSAQRTGDKPLVIVAGRPATEVFLIRLKKEDAFPTRAALLQSFSKTSAVFNGKTANLEMVAKFQAFLKTPEGKAWTEKQARRKELKDTKEELEQAKKDKADAEAALAAAKADAAPKIITLSPKVTYIEGVADLEFLNPTYVDVANSVAMFEYAKNKIGILGLKFMAKAGKIYLLHVSTESSSAGSIGVQLSNWSSEIITFPAYKDSIDLPLFAEADGWFDLYVGAMDEGVKWKFTSLTLREVK